MLNRLLPNNSTRRTAWFAASSMALAGLIALMGVRSVCRGQINVHAADASSAILNSPTTRLREGTLLTDVVGQFRLTGDRATFVPSDGSAKYLALENLTLDRVTQVIAEDPNPLDWVVSGTITEYKGGNFVLLSRAILKNKSTTKSGRFNSR